MEDYKKQAKRRFFHSEAIYVAVSDCYDFVIYPKGLAEAFPGHRSAGNEKILLYFLARHMTQETPEGETTDFKDIAQTFWFKHDYITETIGLSKSRISEALKSLTDAGILIHEVVRGAGQYIAFSDASISAWVEYSRQRALSRLQRGSSGKRNQAVPVSGTGQFRLTEPGSSGERNRAVPVNGTSSYIEDLGIGFRESDLGNSSSGWMEGERQPASKSRYSEVVGIAQDLQQVFAGRSRYIDYATINLFLAGLIDESGGNTEAARKFTAWAKEYVRQVAPEGLVWKDWKIEALGKIYREQRSH